MNDFFEAVKFLLNSGARIDIKDSNNKTALDLAYTNDIARILMVQDWQMRSMLQTLVPSINGKPVLFSNVVNADIDSNIWHMITIFEDDKSSERYRLDVIKQQESNVKSLQDRLYNTGENLGSEDVRSKLTSQLTSNLGILNYLRCYNTWKLFNPRPGSSNPRQSNPTPSNSGPSNPRSSSNSESSNSEPSNLEQTYPGPPKSKRQLRDEEESNTTSTGIHQPENLGPSNSKHQRRDDDGESNAASTNQELRREIANLKERLNSSNQSRMVAICQFCLQVPDAGSSTFSLNCGHLPFCDRCSKSIIENKSTVKRICPICKANANYRFRVFTNVMKYHNSGHDNYAANIVNLEN